MEIISRQKNPFNLRLHHILRLNWKKCLHLRTGFFSRFKSSFEACFITQETTRKFVCTFNPKLRTRVFFARLSRFNFSSKEIEEYFRKKQNFFGINLFNIINLRLSFFVCLCARVCVFCCGFLFPQFLCFCFLATAERGEKKGKCVSFSFSSLSFLSFFFLSFFLLSSFLPSFLLRFLLSSYFLSFFFIFLLSSFFFPLIFISSLFYPFSFFLSFSFLFLSDSFLPIFLLLFSSSFFLSLLCLQNHPSRLHAPPLLSTRQKRSSNFCQYFLSQEYMTSFFVPLPPVVPGSGSHVTYFWASCRGKKKKESVLFFPRERSQLFFSGCFLFLLAQFPVHIFSRIQGAANNFRSTLRLLSSRKRFAARLINQEIWMSSLL